MAKGQRDDHPGTAWSASGEGRIVIGHKESGEPIFRYLSTKTQKELLKKLHQNIEEYRDVDLSENSKMPLGQWLDRWLEEYAAPSVRPSTLEGYRGYIERKRSGSRLAKWLQN